MSDMMDDINKYAAIWDKALAKGIFNNAPKPPTPSEPQSTADFFGQYNSDDYDINGSMNLNESEVKYWSQMAKIASNRSAYHMPLNEERQNDVPTIKKMSNRLGSTFNPVYPNTVGKDQDLGTPVKVTQNWGVGGKELNDLADLKKRLHELEVKLNQSGILKSEKGKKKKDSDESTIIKGMDDLKKQIDDLSDRLNGNNSDAN
jgi:hypothetical protein